MSLRYGIAIWNFMEPGLSLPDLVAELADAGFDAVSFSSGQFPKVGPSEWEEVGALMRDRSLAATIHSSFDVPYEDLDAVMSHLGDELRTVTFDAAMRSDSRGRFYDWAKMSRMLEQVESGTRGRDVLFGVEDYPLDQAALDFYEDEISPAIRRSPRWGSLIDLGHLNMRLREDYYRSLTPEAYIQRVPLPIVEVHVHDNNGDADQHGYMGLGNAPFREIARGLKAAGFDGVSTIEIAPAFHGGKPSEERPLAKESLETWRRMMEQDVG